jgi:hypothetical protein
MIKYYDINDKITFGKYNGFLIKDIIDKHIKYIDWCYIHVKEFHLFYNAFEYYNDRLNETLLNKLL